MSGTFITDTTTIPVAPLKIAALESCREFAGLVNNHIVQQRNESISENHSSIEFKGYKCDSYLLKCACPRFGSGEAKGLVEESVRGADLFVMAITALLILYADMKIICHRMIIFRTLKEL